MGLKLISAPAVEPITLAEAKAQCRVDSSSEDALLTLFIQAAREKAESDTGTAIISQTWEQTLDEFPEAEIELLKPPVSAMLEVQYRDLDGATQTLPNTRYTLDANTFPGWLLPEIDAGWPSTDGSANCVTLRYTTGYPDAASVPAKIRLWMLLTVAFLYEQREAMVIGERISEIPNRYVDGYLDSFRVHKL